jgi:hypothetical protein
MRKRLLLLLLLSLLLRETHSVHVQTSLDAMSSAGKAAVETGGRADYTHMVGYMNYVPG